MRHSTKKVQIDTVNFRRDVEGGTKNLVLAEKYGISAATVCRLKAEISDKIARREPVPDQDEVDAPEAYDITLNVPTDRLADLLAGASAEEIKSAVLEAGAEAQADIFAAVLQGRWNVIEPEQLDPVGVAS